MSTKSRKNSAAPSSPRGKPSYGVGDRHRQAWHPNETRRALLLIANGYTTREVANHLGRSSPSKGPAPAIQGLLMNLDTSVGALRRMRGLTRKERMLRPALPPYDPEAATRAPEDDFPGMTLMPSLDEERTFDEEEIPGERI